MVVDDVILRYRLSEVIINKTWRLLLQKSVLDPKTFIYFNKVPDQPQKIKHHNYKNVHFLQKDNVNAEGLS